MTNTQGPTAPTWSEYFAEFGKALRLAIDGLDSQFTQAWLDQCIDRTLRAMRAEQLQLEAWENEGGSQQQSDSALRWVYVRCAGCSSAIPARETYWRQGLTLHAGFYFKTPVPGLFCRRCAL